MDQETCVACALKHLGTALSFMHEYAEDPEDYDEADVLARGELNAAERHLRFHWPDMADMIRAERKNYEADPEGYRPGIVGLSQELKARLRKERENHGQSERPQEGTVESAAAAGADRGDHAATEDSEPGPGVGGGGQPGGAEAGAQEKRPKIQEESSWLCSSCATIWQRGVFGYYCPKFCCPKFPGRCANYSAWSPGEEGQTQSAKPQDVPDEPDPFDPY